jgi:L-lactate dehydrogenase complex protein LldG
VSARARILADVRGALNRTAPLPESVAQGLESRLERPTANVQPALASEPVALFLHKCADVHSMVTEVPDLAGVAAAVSRHLETHDLGDSLVMAPDPELEAIPWSNRLAIERRAARGTDRVSVTGAFAGVGETGSVVLLSGPESPTTLNFLPEDHIVVLRASRIVAYTEDVWVRLREGRPRLPRTVNFITGPSKTGDVEQVIQEGAHGPRRLHVIVLDDRDEQEGPAP